MAVLLVQERVHYKEQQSSVLIYASALALASFGYIAKKCHFLPHSNVTLRERMMARQSQFKYFYIHSTLQLLGRINIESCPNIYILSFRLILYQIKFIDFESSKIIKSVSVHKWLRKCQYIYIATKGAQRRQEEAMDSVNDKINILLARYWPSSTQNTT